MEASRSFPKGWTYQRMRTQSCLNEGIIFPLISFVMFVKCPHSPFLIGEDAVLTVQLYGTIRAEICMTLPYFEEEELDL